MTAAPPSLDQTISRPDALQDAGSGSALAAAGTVLEGYTDLGSNTIVQESHPQTGVDLTYISQSGDTPGSDTISLYHARQRGRRVSVFSVPSLRRRKHEIRSPKLERNSNFKREAENSNGRSQRAPPRLFLSFPIRALNLFRISSFELRVYQRSSVLDTVASSTATQALTLDSLGNWDGSSVTGVGTTEARTFNAQNQITNNSGSTTPTYDHDGNVTEDDTGTTYTAWNQLATTSAGFNWRFSYLPNGPQASMLTCCGSTVTISYYSTDWQDLEDVPPSGHESTYVWGLENQSELVERDDTSASVRLYAQHDANMDITALVNTSGSVVERFSYTPSGIATVLSSSWASTTDSYNWLFRWQGGRYNTTDGLYTFGYRNYSPTLGTWMQEDPTGYAAGPNVYQAMLGAPIEMTDPYGLDSHGGPVTGPTTGASTQPATNPTSQPTTAPASPAQVLDQIHDLNQKIDDLIDELSKLPNQTDIPPDQADLSRKVTALAKKLQSVIDQRDQLVKQAIGSRRPSTRPAAGPTTGSATAPVAAPSPTPPASGGASSGSAAG
jgi:RHS repeat-associated protein